MRPAFTKSLSNFRMCSDEFVATFLWGIVACSSDPVAVIREKRNECKPSEWSGAYFSRSPLGIAARSMLAIVPTSASVERINSVHLNIHSKARNRVLPQRVRKLLNVAFNRRLSTMRRKRPFNSAVLPLPLDIGDLGDDEEDGEEM